MSAGGLTQHWDLGKGAECPCCGSHIARALRVQLGTDKQHRLSLATARRLGQTLVAYADAIERDEP